MRMSRRSGLLRKAAPKVYAVTYVLYDPNEGLYIEEGTFGTYTAGDTVTVESEIYGEHPWHGYTCFYYTGAYKAGATTAYSTSTTFVMPNFDLTLEYTV